MSGETALNPRYSPGKDQKTPHVSRYQAGTGQMERFRKTPKSGFLDSLSAVLFDYSAACFSSAQVA